MRALPPRLRLAILALVVVTALPGGAVTSAAALDLTDAPLVTSDNVTLVTTRPEAAGAISMAFSSDTPHVYVSTLHGVLVYDTSTPEAPMLVGDLPMAIWQNEAMSLGERPNGEKFVIIASNQALVALGEVVTTNRHILVVEVTDPTAPTLVASLETPTRTHTVSCGSPSCEYAYSDGRTQGSMSIIDLRDFRNPQVAGTYASVVPSGHDQDLDDAGILWHVGGEGSVALDISDPVAPVPLNSTDERGVASGDYTGEPWNNFIHHNSFRPHATSFVPDAPPALESGNVLLVTEEDYLQLNEGSLACGDYEGSFQTWHVPYLDADRYLADNPDLTSGGGTIAPLDRWNTELLESGVTTPAGAFCSAHYFDYSDAGFVAQGWYQQGTRILDVRDPSDIKQIGYFFTGAQETWAAYWVPVRNANGVATDKPGELVYTADVVRGLDVLHVDLPVGPPEETPARRAPIHESWLVADPTLVERLHPDWNVACPLPPAL